MSLFKSAKGYFSNIIFNGTNSTVYEFRLLDESSKSKEIKTVKLYQDIEIYSNGVVAKHGSISLFEINS